MRKITLLSFLLLFTAPFLKAQTIINPVSASSTLSAQFGSDIAYTIDGSGLTGFPTLTGSHSMTTPTNSYLAANAAGSIDFDLGNTYMVDGFSFWNQNAPGPGATGVKDVVISASTDGINFTPISGSPILFAQVVGPTSSEEQFTFPAVAATHIRIDVVSNYGDPGNLVAFAEIAFSGVQSPMNVINPVSATTTLSPQFGSDVLNTINGNGLSVFPALTGSHSMTTPMNSFLASNAVGSIDFDLGSIYLVDGLSFWNQNAPGPGATGIKDVVISASTDGINFTPIGGSPILFAQVMGPTSSEEQFTFPAVAATHIRIDVASNYGDPGNLVAFAEIAFSGVQSQLNLKDEGFSNSISLYPNPATDYVTIGSTSSSMLEGIDIYDLNGSLLKKVKVSGNFDQKINISDLPTGLYMFHVYNGDFSAMKRVIKK